MQAGELRHRITIQRITKEKGTDGETKTVYRDLATVWAKANGLYGKEWWDAKDYGAEGTVEFTIRQNAAPSLRVEDRILFRGRLYNIFSVDNVLFSDKFLKIKAAADLTYKGE